ncbi:MAG: hypothetical protein D6763_07920, partial [Alphaproteobacteria bacterium]
MIPGTGRTVASLTNLNTSERDLLSFGAGLVVLLAIYFVLYGALLVASDFVPYVFDNNESFSNLNHARNLITFGVAKSIGLADEAVSPFAAAHPVVHTHQGNWPRLFSSTLYILGARTIETQITLTTFTIGLGAVAMAYVFFTRLVSPIFALIAGLVLITDYIFFAQWQVNTYRVWIPFFIFSSLLCAHGLTGQRFRSWLFLTYVNASALFYYEFVFVAFTAVMTGLYIGWQLRNDRRRLLAGWSALGFGAITGLGILTLQLVAYLGWQDFLTDARLTFFARNAGGDLTATMRMLKNFYSERNIAFFFNLGTGDDTGTWTAFWNSFTAYQFEVLTPFIVVIVFMAVTGAILRRLCTAVSCRLKAWSLPQHAMPLARIFAIFAAFLFLTEIWLDTSILGRWQANGLWGAEHPFAIVLSIVLVVLAAIAFLFLTFRLAPAPSVASVVRLGSVGTFLILSTLWISAQPGLYHASREPLWGVALLPPLGLWIDRIAVLCIATAWIVALLLPEPEKSANADRRLGSLIPFFVCGLVAYAIAYRFAPGYIYTGYLYRGETFLVAHLDAAVAVGFYLTGTLAWEFLVRTRRLAPVAAIGGVARSAHRLMRITTLTSGIVLIVVIGQWGYVQGRYMQLMPPDQFAFAARLTEPPLKGKSVVTNAYAVPFAWLSESWGYMDPFGLFFDRVRETETGFVAVHDTRYLWFADRNVNPAYERPDLFVCFYNISFDTVAARLANRKQRNDCLDSPLVKRALSDSWRPFRHRIVARDSRDAANWAIVALDWMTPPYLKPLNMDDVVKNPPRVRIGITRLDDGYQIHAFYVYAHQEGEPEGDTRIRLY